MTPKQNTFKKYTKLLTKQNDNEYSSSSRRHFIQRINHSQLAKVFKSFIKKKDIFYKKI